MTQQPFSLLLQIYPSPAMAQVLSADRSVRDWVAFEHALARAQARAGVLTETDAEAICAVDASQIDLDALWSGARNVGYPILSLVRQMTALLPDGPNGRVHYGATTQDVMDTGQSMMLAAATEVLLNQTTKVGDHLAEHVASHAATVMPGRTHGQQAVPTTLGAHLAPTLAELARNHSRMRAAGNEAAMLSLYGAGGTSAALGEHAAHIRQAMGEDLGLVVSDVPWHTARDRAVALAQVCVLVSGSCARLARNVIDLSRTEIGEIFEAAGSHRGASSTMPQKANPILSEGIIGMSGIVSPLVAALGRALEAPQERAAGEWQIEWHVLPQVLQLTSSILAATEELLDGLRIDADAMRRNLSADGGLIMAEAAMISLADQLGRERAHDVVYAAALAVRSDGIDLPEAIRAKLAADGHDESVTVPEPAEYVGDVQQFCQAALEDWRNARTAG